MSVPGPVAGKADRAGIESFARLALANIGVAVAAFGLASVMAMMQALSRANLDLPFRSAGMYYMSVTAHGTLMALVFTTFFIMGFGYVVAQHSLGTALAMRRTAWVSFWIAVLGTVATVIVILAGKATVLYTFYPPLKAHPAFYIGLSCSEHSGCGAARTRVDGFRSRCTGTPQRSSCGSSQPSAWPRRCCCC